MLGTSTSSAPRISVVIPHLNEPEDLRRCLSALEQQKSDGIPFEIIVVDNGSRELPSLVCSAFQGVRLEHEPVPGPGPARSRGALQAGGDIIAFIDADCLAQEGWIRNIADYFDNNPEVDFISGHIGIAKLAPDRTTALEAYDSVFSYRVQLYVQRDHYAATGNMAVRTATFRSVGPFGGIAISEDKEWGQRATAQGHRLAYVPQVRALTPACRSFAELARRWDRHIAHDFEEVRRAGGTHKWVLRSLAVAASPLIEIAKAPYSRQELDVRGQLLALACLVRIRLYRARKMLALTLRDRTQQMVGAWNRGER